MLKRILLFALLAVSAANAQTLGLTPDWVQQFFDNNGNPLAGGRIFTCSAGASCPGTPLPTWTDSSAFTLNANPVILDSNGRPPSGGGIWLGCLSNYKLVLQDSTGVTIKTVDNVSCAAFNSSGGGGTQYWQLSGSTISNTNASGAGNVSIGGGLSVINNIQTNSGFVMRSPAGISHLATIQAAGVMPADQTWRWPAVDAVGCLSSDGTGNLTFATCGGGGGGGSPGGNSSDVQWNNSGVLGGTDNFQWQNASQRIVITGISSTPGIVVLNGWIQADGGFDAIINSSPSTAQPYNIVQAPTGGMHALSFTADKYVETGSSNGPPTATTGEGGYPHAGAVYCDTGSSPCVEKLYNGSAWITLATGGATSPGGSDTNVQFNSSGSFAGSGNMIWSNSLQRLTITGVSSATPGIHVGNGYVDSDAGFVALPGTATQFNSIRATAGGMAANSFTATSYVQTGHNPGPFSSSPPTPTNSDSFAAGALSFDVAGNAENVFNGTSWVPLGGGGSSPGGPTTSIQYNNAGTLAGNSNLTWNNGSQVLTLGGNIAFTTNNAFNIGSSAAEVGIISSQFHYSYQPGVITNYCQFTWAGITCPNGGITTVAIDATTGSSLWSFLAGTGTRSVCADLNGKLVICGATGGVTSLNTLTGALTISGTTSQISANAFGSTITLSTPQNIATTSAVNFASVTASGPLVSNATGTSNAILVNGTSFVVQGNGNVGLQSMNAQASSGAAIIVNVDSDANSISTPGGIVACRFGTCGSSAALTVNGSIVINSSGQYTGPILTPIGGAPSTIQIGIAGNFFTRPIAALSGALNCSGVPDALIAVTTVDNYLVTCIGGTRMRVPFTSY